MEETTESSSTEDHEACFPRGDIPSNFKDKHIRDSNSNFEDKMCKDARSNVEDKTQRYISSQDEGSDDVGRPPAREDESRLSSDVQLDNILRKEDVCKNGVAIKPEMNCEVIDKTNYWDDGNGVIENKLHNEIKNSQEHENDISSESHTDKKDVITIPVESIEINGTICSNKNDILHDIKDPKEMNPRTEGKGEMVPDDKKSKETNKDPTLSGRKGYMNNALGDKRKDEPKLHTDYMREKWKSIDTSIESTLRTPITSLSKTNEFKIMSVANIIIF